MDNHLIYIDGNRIGIPSDYKILNLNDNIYVPLRFLSENMGHKLFYDKNNRSVYISNNLVKLNLDIKKENEYKEQIAKLREEIASLKKKNDKIYDEKTELVNKIEYKKIPITYKNSSNNLEITLYHFLLYNDLLDSTDLYIRVKNDYYIPVSINTDSIKVTYRDIHGTDHDLNIKSGKKEFENFEKEYQSHNIYQSFPQGSDEKVFFSVDRLPEDVKYGVLTFYYSYVGDTEKHLVEMPISFK